MSNNTTATTNKNIKVYPTSIVPKGEKIVAVRPSGFVASSFQIEVVHIGVFFVLFFCIFAGIWKTAVKKQKDEDNKMNSTGLNHK